MPRDVYTDIVIHADPPLWWVTFTYAGQPDELTLDAGTELDARREAAALLDVDVDCDGDNLLVEWE